MEPLSVIKDSDIFENPIAEPKFYTIRPTVKAIVLDEEGAIAMLSIDGHSLFPGGGVEGDETKEEALIRECKEEIGCDVIPIGYIGDFIQYRSQTAKKYEISFFIAHVIGEKGSPTTLDDSERECIISWDTKENIHQVLQDQLSKIHEDDYSTQFNVRTHFLAFERFLEMRL